MDLSDDELDGVVESVSNYEFEDENNEPVSFSLLPIQWDAGEKIDDEEQLQVFLKGNTDNGFRTAKQATRWKFDLEKASPEISVFTKEKNWIKLGKPRKAFEEQIIRTVLITLHCLHFARRNVFASEKSLWHYLSRVFSTFIVKPSRSDLVDHVALIAEAVKRDDILKKCKVLLAFLGEKQKKKIDESAQASKLSEFINDDADDYMSEDAEDGDEESNDDDDLFDPVCVFCDNGGSVLCCEGECLRSFHATKEAGTDSFCESLGMTDGEVEEISKYICDNCKYKQHQCFACGKLGSSDKSSSAEVFRCINATCGHFYHPRCIANLLHCDDEVVAKELQEKVAAGEKFACPIHKCSVCKQPENKKEADFQFAVCRRCPTSYHRKCLPREIGFEDIDEENILTRAWEDLLPNRILIYCLKHEIDDDIGTPVRDHVKFPFRREKCTTEEKSRKLSAEFPERKKMILDKRKRISSDNSFSERTIEKAPREMSSAAKEIQISRKAKISRKVERLSSTPDLARKFRASGESTRSVRDNALSSLKKSDGQSTATENNPSLGERLYSLMTMQSENEDSSSSKLNKPLITKATSQKCDSEMVQLDLDEKKRILCIMQEATKSVTLKDVMEKHKIPSTHTSSLRKVVDKTITQGKVEGAVEAVRTALQKLQDGCNSDDARAVCEPEVLNQIFKWKNMLRVYLAPFLYNMRYTSFGRHFTKEDKLKEIVDMLHWYVQTDDMVVDFCCGANDFSCLMKKKLEETRKTCLYKNYDIVQAKNDFSFEKRDWMTVKPKELPREGSQLIMGLNPPFGIKAGLANKFIDKALEFKPKLLILIVPPETERLDKKSSPYDLVWEDYNFLSGKSFYLPGSVDINDKQMDQWNIIPPVLYLWSRRDWSAKHKAIAEKNGHISMKEGRSSLGNDNQETKFHFGYGDIAVPMSDSLKQNKQQESLNNEIILSDGHVDGSLGNSSDVESQSSRAPGTRRSGERRYDGRDMDGQLPKDNQTGASMVANAYQGISCHSSPNVLDDRMLLEGQSVLGAGRIKAGESRRKNCERIGKDLSRISPKERHNIANEHKVTCHSSSPHVVDNGFLLDHQQSNLFQTQSHQENHQDNYQHVEPGTSSSPGQYEAPYDTNLASSQGNSGAYSLSEHVPHSLSNVGHMEPHYTELSRERIGYGTYIAGLDRGTDLQSKLQLYGQDLAPYSQGHVLCHDPGYAHRGPVPSLSYGHAGPAIGPSYMTNVSATQRYAPRLDELNHIRMNEFDSAPLIYDNDFFGSRPPFFMDPLHFPPGPHNRF